jgi:hypothetical protein
MARSAVQSVADGKTMVVNDADPRGADVTSTERIDSRRVDRIVRSVRRFLEWLDAYGETSYDFQTVYASRVGRGAKSLYYEHPGIGKLAVAPMVVCEAFLPSARRMFFKPQRFPIADAHYAMGFARLYRHTGHLYHLDRARHFLEVLLNTSCQGRSGFGWGYPFDWVTVDGTIPAGTPLITTLPYVYEAFASVYKIDHQLRWLQVMRSMAAHAAADYVNHPASAGASASYSPLTWDRGQVVNASAYRAFLLARAGRDLERSDYAEAAEPNLRFVVAAQNNDGSWPYATDGRRQFIDHFHTCFVLKSLIKIEALTGSDSCAKAITAGLRYYEQSLFDSDELPRPFAVAPRRVLYRRELYDYAECLNLATLAQGRSAHIEALATRAVEDLLSRWQKPDGSFRSRQLLWGWDEVPMHRWAQAQLFRSLCGLLPGAEKRSAPNGASPSSMQPAPAV